MERLFSLIDCTFAMRTEFVANEGRQPTDALFIVTDGKFELEMDGVTTLVGTGDVVILPASRYFRRHVIETIGFWYIKFKKNPKASSSLSLPYGKVELSDSSRILSDLELYDRVSNLPASIRFELKEHLLEHILFQACFEHSRLIHDDEKKYIDDANLSTALDYIEQHLSDKITLADLSRASCCAPSALTQKFKKQWGLSPIAFVIEKRIDHAKDLLLNTAYPMSYIAAKCGFSNEYYFSSCFKKVVGCSPLGFRKK